jgi:hypothetical protein
VIGHGRVGRDECRRKDGRVAEDREPARREPVQIELLRQAFHDTRREIAVLGDHEPDPERSEQRTGVPSAAGEEPFEDRVQLVVAAARPRAALVEGGYAVAVREAEPHGPVAGLGQRDRVAAGRWEPVAVRFAEPQDAERSLRGRGDHRPRGRQATGPHRPLGERDLERLPGDADGQYHRQDRHPELPGPEGLPLQPLAERRESVGEERALGDRGRPDPHRRVAERRRQLPGDRRPCKERPRDRHDQRSPRAAALRIPRAGEADDGRDRQERCHGPGARPRPGREPQQGPRVRRPDLGGQGGRRVTGRRDHDRERERRRGERGEHDQRRTSIPPAAGHQVHQGEQGDGQDDGWRERRTDRQRDTEADTEAERMLGGASSERGVDPVPREREDREHDQQREPSLGERPEHRRGEHVRGRGHHGRGR